MRCAPLHPGCITGIEPHLPILMSLLINALNDPKVRHTLDHRRKPNVYANMLYLYVAASRQVHCLLDNRPLLELDDQERRHTRAQATILCSRHGRSKPRCLSHYQGQLIDNGLASISC